MYCIDEVTPGGSLRKYNKNQRKKGDFSLQMKLCRGLLAAENRLEERLVVHKLNSAVVKDTTATAAIAAVAAGGAAPLDS